MHQHKDLSDVSVGQIVLAGCLGLSISKIAGFKLLGLQWSSAA